MPEKESKKLDKIIFKYRFPPDYNPIYVNGAWGGVSTKGEIFINFFLQRTPLPKEIVQEVNEDGSLGDEIKCDPNDLKESLLRYVRTGIIVNLEDAKSIHEWLGQKIQILEKLKEGDPPNV